MTTWEEVEHVETGTEMRVTTADGFVHGIVFEKNAANRSITFHSQGRAPGGRPDEAETTTIERIVVFPLDVPRDVPKGDK
jgi:hypothetical protein